MIEDFLYLTWLQGLGTAFGIVQVLLSRKNNVHNYLFGILSVLISIYVLYQSRLYADIILHLYYFVMSVYGWFYWKYGNQKQESPISFTTKKESVQAILIVMGCFALMAYWLRFYTNSDVPYWDAGVTAFAWAGMWLMAKRKLENWIFLNISNAISIPLLWYKELYIYVGLTVFLFVMGVSGYLKWRKIIRDERDYEYSTA